MNYNSALYIGSNHSMQAVNLHLCLPLNVCYINTVLYHLMYLCIHTCIYRLKIYFEKFVFTCLIDTIHLYIYLLNCLLNTFMKDKCQMHFNINIYKHSILRFIVSMQ